MILGEKRGKLAFIAGDIICVIFGLFLSYKIFAVMRNTMLTNQTFPAIPWLPTWVLYLAGVLGTLGFSVRIIEREVRSIRGSKKEVEEA